MRTDAQALALAETFHRQGYCVVPRLASPSDVARVFREVEAIFAQALRHLGQEEQATASLDDQYAWLQANAPRMKARCYDLLGRLHSVQGIVGDARLAALGLAVYDSPLLVDHTQIRIDDGENKRLQPVHQELGQLSDFILGIWIPLRALSEESGGLRILPGSHKRGRVRHQYFPEQSNYHGVCPELYDEEALEEVRIEAGDALVFHPYLFHGSVPNRSASTRWTLVTRLSELTRVGYLHSDTAPLRNPQHLDG